jgi:hypothetical protein
LHQATVALLFHGPNDVIPDDLLALKGIAHLLEEAGAAFGICHTELMQEEGARRVHEASDGPVGAAATDGFGLNHLPHLPTTSGMNSSMLTLQNPGHITSGGSRVIQFR